MLKNLEGSLPSSSSCLHASDGDFQTSANWPAETGAALSVPGSFIWEKVGVFRAALLAVLDRKVDASFCLTAVGHAPVVDAPKPVSVAEERWVLCACVGQPVALLIFSL